MKEKILALLRQSNDYISGQNLCEQLNVSRTAVWKAVNALKAEGYQIVTPILVCNPDAFTVEPAAGGTVAAGDALLTLKKK